MKPWQQLPFQYSIHMQDKPGGELNHFSFLADLEKGNQDPRPEILKGLQKYLGDSGSIVAYNAGFETARLNEMTDAFLEYRDWWENNVNPRMVDLLKPFRSFAFYDSSQCGSSSIKVVLPSLVGSGYEDLDISEGGSASAEYWRISIQSNEPDDVDRIREALEKYCAMDTEAEALIVDRLKSIVML